MKNILLIFAAAAVLFSCSGPGAGDHNFALNGTLQGDYSGQAFLYKREAGEWVKLDSVVVENNTFRFEGNLDMPELYYISIEGQNRFASFFAEPSEISLTTTIEDFGKPEITGSAAQDEYDALNDGLAAYEDELGESWTRIKAAREAEDAEGLAEAEADYEEAEAQMQDFIIDYAMEHSASVVAAYMVLRNSYYYDENDLAPVVENFDPAIAASPYVVSLAERVEVLQRVAVGMPAVDFTMDDADGNPVQLSSLYGKYLLVDFWASWCGPCRQENPNVVAAYKEYGPKGFDILGVSFDKDKDKWLEAVGADELTWHHVSDLQGWGNAAGKLYGVNSIPANILLDPEGTIIAKNLRGEDLHAKLGELMAE